MSKRDTANAYLDTHWRNCVRCSLAKYRCDTNPRTNKVFGYVPKGVEVTDSGATRHVAEDKPYYFMLDMPDTVQQNTGELSSKSSPQWSLIRYMFETLGDVLPDPITECGFGLALGCRSIDFNNPNYVVKPNPSQGKSCRNRWMAELSSANPFVTYVSGPNALAVVLPQYGTKYGKIRGEVLSGEMWALRSRYANPHKVSVPMYVGPSFESTLRNARDDQWDLTGWDISPTPTPQAEPVKDLAWHLLWYMWLTKTAQDLYEAPLAPLHDNMETLIKKLNEFYEDRAYSMFDIKKLLTQLSNARKVREEMMYSDLTEEVIPEDEDGGESDSE